ncbi:hypothetical protein CC86DRAFT_367496 [Ophiobolus disseminans]|uniref:Xylanolytic transcriptional activator regulatory domain-containing protein n=1 Tax=Ophiobolus disseminans TaxID=1469910 RepID=A0A6A7AC63_9PLEO|nr:hypothetical protein CC86DRAFT_367496 [Ophiobolus disseminans]
MDCIFNTSKPPRKKHKRIKVQFLADRLNQYESLLREHGIDTSKLPGSATVEPSSRTSQAPIIEPQDTRPRMITSNNNKAQDDEGNRVNQACGSEQFKFVENSLWTRIVEEAYDPAQTLDTSDASSDEDASDDGHGFVLTNQPKPNHRPRHPRPENMHQLWDIFVENVDPLSKVVHVLTLKPAFQKAAADPSGTIPRSFEALMFAIYSTAIMSLNDDECRRRFSEPHQTLLSLYTHATAAALSRAKFMGTTSLVVLQALVLHLLAVRDIYEPRALYTLTGVAVRIAQTMGLERDGTVLGLSPFETEIRRRIWWQLKMHDFRTAELCGLAKFRDLDMGAESTKWPTNVDDDQLYPNMPSLAAAENRVTDVLFVAFRCEMTEFAVGRVAKFRKQGLTTDQWNLHEARHDKGEIENAVKGLQDVLEMKYIRYCDPSRPLHLLTMLVGRYAMNVVTFLTHHPRSWASMGQVSAIEWQLVWDVSIKLLEQHNMVQSNPMLRPFAWHAIYFRQWHAFIHVLDILRTEPLKADASKAWELVISTYDNAPAMLSDMEKPIHVAIGSLCLKAYAARETAYLKTDMHLPPTPDFIVRLRQGREDAKEKRQTRSRKTPRLPESSDHRQAGITEVGQISASHALSQSDPSPATFAIPDAPFPLEPVLEPTTSNDSDPFHLFDEFDRGQIDNSAMDYNFMLPDDYNMEDSSFEPIDWEQWDTWLADSNMMSS